jgi:hypothetical protein
VLSGPILGKRADPEPGRATSSAKGAPKRKRLKSLHATHAPMLGWQYVPEPQVPAHERGPPVLELLDALLLLLAALLLLLALLDALALELVPWPPAPAALLLVEPPPGPSAVVKGATQATPPPAAANVKATTQPRLRMRSSGR